MEAAIVGAGNFGTAVANIVAANGVDVHLCMRDEAQLADMLVHGENRRYLPGHPLADRVQPTSDLAGALATSEVAFVTVPSASFRDVTCELAGLVAPGTCVISATKGIESGVQAHEPDPRGDPPADEGRRDQWPQSCGRDGGRPLHGNRRGKPSRGICARGSRESSQARPSACIPAPMSTAWNSAVR